MKTLITITLAIMATACQSQDSFSWLEGSWTNQKNGMIEEWNANNEELIGSAYKTDDSDTTIYERLAIKKVENEWYYIADVSHNAEPTLFKMTLMEDHHFICENPEHDFPKQIEYTLTDKTLLVTISDEQKAINFEFKRTSE